MLEIGAGWGEGGQDEGADGGVVDRVGEERPAAKRLPNTGGGEAIVQGVQPAAQGVCEWERQGR